MTLKNGMELEISKTQKSDAAEWIEYSKIVGGESDNLSFGENGIGFSLEEEEGFIENTQKQRGSALFVAKIDGEIVGDVSVLAFDRERMAHIAELGISVRRDYWRLGIGEALMRTALEHARNAGEIEIVHLGVRRENENAIKLYKKLGFVENGVFPKFFKVGDKYYDEILMDLEL